MPRSCTICAHDQRRSIDAAIAAKRSSRDIASKHNVSPAAVLRHKQHITDMIAALTAEAQAATADAVAQLVDDRRGPLDAAAQLARLVDETWTVYAGCTTEGDRRGQLLAISEQRANIRLSAELAGDVQTQGTAKILLSTEYAVLAGVLDTELAPYPDAKLAIAHALEALEGS